MYKLIKALSLSIILSVSIFAQATTDADSGDTTQPTTGASQTTGSDYNKNEYYVGYSNQQVDTANRSTFHGFEGSYTRNVSRWIGIRGSISGAYRNQRFDVPFLVVSTPNVFLPISTYSVESKSRVYNFLGGVQIKDNASTKRFKPFAFALGGVAVNTNRTFATSCPSNDCTLATAQFFKYSDTGLSGAFGGGLDIKINNRVDFRAIQFDYNPIYSDSRVDNNFRIGVGFVFK